MNLIFEELDYQQTSMGELILRRRAEPRLGGREIYEVKLGDEFLMSSLFSEGEAALARLALDELSGREPLDVIVGGLGLGYTAAAALEYAAVRSLRVIETQPAVIDWHRRGLVPLGETLGADPRCRMIHDDFFRLAARGLDSERPGRRFHAVLLDIDHAPDHLLHPGHAAFYDAGGLRALTRQLQPGGVFALWSNAPPDAAFLQRLESCFAGARAQVIDFPNPYTGGEAANTIYLASVSR